MNNRGIAIIFSFLVTILLLGFLGVVCLQTLAESRHVHRYVNSVNAFWLAEAGVAHVKSNLGAPSSLSGTMVNPSDPSGNTYAYNVVSSQIGISGYYNVISTGIVTFPGSVIRRVVNVTMKVIPPDPSKFQYCVETTGDTLEYKNKNVKNEINPENLVKKNSTQAFTDLFGVSMATMKANSTYFTDTTLPVSNTIAASGVTWVDVTQGSPPELSIQHLNGSGIVIINGDFRLNGVAGGGGSTFNGILYVVGKLWMSGNATVNGTVFVESAADISAENELTGSALVEYNPANIASALGSLSTKTIVSWREN